MNDSLKLLLKGVATQNLQIPDVSLTHPYSTPANFEGIKLPNTYFLIGHIKITKANSCAITNPATTPTNTVKYPVFGD
jgi:hypothetical protein